MDIERFEHCAAAYGADRRRWPPADRAVFDRHAATPQGAAILAAAERADRFLDGWQVAPPGAGLATAIAGEAAGARVRGRPRRRMAWGAAAFAASALLGFAIGFAQVRDAGDADLVARLILGPADVQEIGL